MRAFSFSSAFVRPGRSKVTSKLFDALPDGLMSADELFVHVDRRPGGRGVRREGGAAMATAEMITHAHPAASPTRV
jgi:hypothetical protein